MSMSPLNLGGGVKVYMETFKPSVPRDITSLASYSIISDFPLSVINSILALVFAKYTYMKMWFLSALVQNVKQATKFKAERIF